MVADYRVAGAQKARSAKVKAGRHLISEKPDGVFVGRRKVLRNCRKCGHFNLLRTRIVVVLCDSSHTAEKLYAAGLMFWFTQKKFFGSYFFLMAERRG